MENVNDNYFKGNYKDIWRLLIPEILTSRELDFIINYFHLQPGDSVLDLMCGYGRHTLGLAAQGMHVTAIDNLEEYTSEVALKTTQSSLPVTVINENIVTAAFDGKFKLAICMGNSLNFFNERDLKTILKKVNDHLVNGGHLLINSWSIEEIAIPSFKDRAEGMINSLKFVNESKLLPDPRRIEMVSTIINEKGEKEVKKATDYIYSLEELGEILHHCGFYLKEVYSIPGKKKFSPGEPRAYIVCVKK